MNRKEELSPFDILVEQAAQEIQEDGVISSVTQMQFQALAEGKPLSGIDVNSPDLQRLTAALLNPPRPSLIQPPVNGNEEDDCSWVDCDLP